MQSCFQRLKQGHHFLIDQALYPILLSTFLTALFFVGRVFLSRKLIYLFLPWNLFLAWIPYLSSFAVAYLYHRYPRRRRYLIIPGLIWLAFFPNAPYLITDFVHLDWYRSVPIWYDIVLLAAGAWTGLFLAVFSLRTMQQLVNTFLGTMVSWLFVGAVLGLTGLGVYVGRFLDWNSWDLLVHPIGVMSDISSLFISPLANWRAFGFMFQVAAFMLVCYLTVTMTRSPKRF